MWERPSRFHHYPFTSPISRNCVCRRVPSDRSRNHCKFFLASAIRKRSESGYVVLCGLHTTRHKMSGIDPTYPLYPVATILVGSALLLVPLDMSVRRNWNLSIAFLCISLSIENLYFGVNAIIWADNATVKLDVYCDIATRFQLAAGIVRASATLTILRHLYLIAKLQPVEILDNTSKRRDVVIQWVLGLVLPLLVAGPLYLVVERTRFAIIERFGCQITPDNSILGILFIWSWNIACPLLSIVLYYPTVVRVFYNHYRAMSGTVYSSSSVRITNYARILAVASIDIITTLPYGITSLALAIKNPRSTGSSISFYPGWARTHENWEPTGLSYADFKYLGPLTAAEIYFAAWAPVALAYAVFGLFGITREARASYMHVFRTMWGWVGWRSAVPESPSHVVRSRFSTIEFGDPVRESTLVEVAAGARSSLSTVHPDTREEKLVGKAIA
ncbi:unnamed protein product [Peniophora sp. CBMAI 1063]|nr:unnamed protein product [Peniophora sp. CBMAI 1063]